MKMNESEHIESATLVDGRLEVVVTFDDSIVTKKVYAAVDGKVALVETIQGIYHPEQVQPGWIEWMEFRRQVVIPNRQEGDA